MHTNIKNQPLETPVKELIVNVENEKYETNYSIQYFPDDLEKGFRLFVRSKDFRFPPLSVEVTQDIFNSDQHQIDAVNNLVNEYFKLQNK